MLLEKKKCVCVRNDRCAAIRVSKWRICCKDPFKFISSATVGAITVYVQFYSPRSILFNFHDQIFSYEFDERKGENRKERKRLKKRQERDKRAEKLCLGNRKGSRVEIRENKTY